jgi:outer membrane receptor for ferrienterochelin and colicins
MKKQFTYVYLIGFLLIFCQKINAQNPTTAIIIGKVGTAQNPIPFANIVLLPLQKGVVSDSLGNFKFEKVPFGTYTLQISVVGYDVFQQNILVQEKEVLVPKIVLNPSENSLQEVVVTGTMKETTMAESPVAIQRFSPKFFARNPTSNFFDALQTINGVKTENNCGVCNTGDIRINGMEGAYSMILIDGMPIMSALATVYGLNGIPNAIIDRVEVIKGASSTLYGSEAVAGLLNVITKSPEKAPNLSVDIFGTSYRELNVDVAKSMRFGKVSSLLSANYFHFDNIWDINNDGFTDLSLQKRFSVFNKWNLQRKQQRQANLAIRYLYEDRWGGQTSWQRQHRGTEQVYGESIFTSRFEVLGNYQLPIHREKILLQYSYNYHDQNSVYGSMWYLGTQQVAFGQLLWDKKIGKKHDILVGTTLRYTYYDDNTPATASLDSLNPQNQPQKVYLPAVFVQDEITLHPKHKLLVGARYDHHSQHGTVFSPRLAYKWTLKDGTILRANVGNGFRVVNVFTEDHAALTGARKVVFKNTLRPEQSWNFTINYQKTFYTSIGKIGIMADGFYSYFTNRILPDYTTDANKIIYDNLNGYAVTRGLALNFDIDFKFPLCLVGGITVLDAFQIENNQRLDLFKASPLSGTFTASYDFEKPQITLDWTGNFYSPMLLPTLPNDFRPTHSPWYSLQNIQITKKFTNGIELYGGIKNLFNFLPENPILRPFDPFDKQTNIDNPNGYTFDASYTYAVLQGRRAFFGVRYLLK